MITILDKDGKLLFDPQFLDRREANSIHYRLIDDLDWRSESIRIYGADIASPRLVSWYGDPQAIYTYSGIVHYPLPWHPTLLQLKNRLETLTGEPFNSVLCNWYRDGNDSMGWHADKEKELGPAPYLASLSVGATRTFKIRHRKSAVTHCLTLENGSLVVMSGKLQQYWRHSVPKTRKRVAGRINLSFRNILSKGSLPTAR